MSRRRAVAAALSRAGRLTRFAVWFTGRLMAANAVVAWEILTPRSRLAPGIVDLQLRCRTTAEIVTLANLISLTPGTLTVDLNVDSGSAPLTIPPTIHVHGMHAADADAFRDELRDLETRLLAALRPRAAPGPDRWEEDP